MSNTGTVENTVVTSTNVVERLQAVLTSAREAYANADLTFRRVRATYEKVAARYELARGLADKEIAIIPGETEEYDLRALFDLERQAEVELGNAEEDKVMAEAAYTAAEAAYVEAVAVQPPVEVQPAPKAKKPAVTPKAVKKVLSRVQPAPKATTSEKPAVEVQPAPKAEKPALPPLSRVENAFNARLPKGYELLYRDFPRADGTGGFVVDRVFYLRLGTRTKSYDFPASSCNDCSNSDGLYCTSLRPERVAYTRNYATAEKWMLQFVSYDGLALKPEKTDGAPKAKTADKPAKAKTADKPAKAKTTATPESSK